MQGHPAQDREERRIARHLQTEIDRFLQREGRSETGGCSDPEPIATELLVSSLNRRQTKTTKATTHSTAGSGSSSAPPSAASCR